MRHCYGLVLMAALAASACARGAGPQVTPQAPIPVTAPAVDTTTAATTTTTGKVAATANRAEVKLVAPKAVYTVQAELLPEPLPEPPPATTVHHWTVDDILEYVVELKPQTAPDTFGTVGAVSVTVPVKGPDAKTSAVFTALPWGSKYRAFVTALGNDGGVIDGTIANSSLLPMNTVPGTADFDFLITQNIPASITRPVQIVFDAIPFNGIGQVTVIAPPDGVFNSPPPDITGSAE